MSQPHDGDRSSLPFGNPFRLIFSKASYISPEYTALLNSFEQTLAESLKKLKPEDISEIWSLAWLSHAMNFLSETHNNINTFITGLELPVYDWEAEWIDLYLDNSVKLLDICIAMSSKLSRLDQSQVTLKFVLHILDSSEQLSRAHTTLSDWMHQTNSRSSDLENCCVILQDLARTLHSSKVKSSEKGKILLRALYGVKVVTIFVCSVFVSALSGSSKSIITLAVPEKFLWAGAFNDLQADVLKETAKRLSEEKAIALKELECVENCVKKLCILNGDEEKEKWEGVVFEMAEATSKLSHGLDCLSKQMENFFHIVLTGRDALLCNLGACDEEVVQEIGHIDE